MLLFIFGRCFFCGQRNVGGKKLVFGRGDKQRIKMNIGGQ